MNYMKCFGNHGTELCPVARGDKCPHTISDCREYQKYWKTNPDAVVTDWLRSR